MIFRSPLQIAMEINKIDKDKERLNALGYSNRRSSIHAEFILWGLLRAIDRGGKAIPVEDVIRLLSNSGRSESRLREVISYGSGLFFVVTRKKRTGELMLMLRSASKVEAGMGIEAENSAEAVIELPGGDSSVRTIFSLLYRAWIMERTDSGKKSFIISRNRITESWGVSPTTVTRWEKVAQIRVVHNFASSDITEGGSDVVANRHIPNNRNGDGAVFVRDGVLHWQLPNTYSITEVNSDQDNLPEHAKTKTHKRESGSAELTKVLNKVRYFRNKSLKELVRENKAKNTVNVKHGRGDDPILLPTENEALFGRVFVGKESESAKKANAAARNNIASGRSYYQRQDQPFKYRSRRDKQVHTGGMWHFVSVSQDV